MPNQGYEVVFVERFRPLGLPDFKRIFLKRRQYSAKKGLITEGGLRLAGSATAGLAISGIGGLHLAAGASYLTRVAATGGLILGATASETRPTTGAGGLNLAGSAHVIRPYVATGGLHLAGNARVVRPYRGAGGPHLAGTATHHPEPFSRELLRARNSHVNPSLDCATPRNIVDTRVGKVHSEHS
jgi:hypothetical protein